jgi:hypothetical protein
MLVNGSMTGVQHNILQVRLGLVDTVHVALQQLDTGKSANFQLGLNLIDSSLLQLEAVTGAHSELRSAVTAQAREVIFVGIGEDLGVDQAIGLSNNGAHQGETAHQCLN